MNHHLAENAALTRSSPILIADDNSMWRNILRMILDAYGYRCLEAPNGKTALGIIRTSSIGFIITDFHMPDVNGCELLEQLPRDGSACPPAVLVTGDLTDRIQQRALQAGAITVLEKPFDQKILIEIIHLSYQQTAHCQGVRALSSTLL
ncbi:MAG: response regulator [Nitrospirales bacterium]